MILLRNKYFAGRDYAGLDEISKANQREYRNMLAKELNEKRNKINERGSLLATADKQTALNVAKTKSKTNQFKERFKTELRSPEKVASSYSRHADKAEKLRAKKLMGQNLKKAGYVGLGVAGAAGLAYGAKKLYDRNKASQQAQQ